jgi:hypothetical protein
MAAAAAATMAVIYFLIGLRLLDIGGSSTTEQVDLGMFGASAGTAFLVIAVLALAADRRWIWVAAATFQLFVYVTYFATSGIRVPPFETWGLTLRLVQVPLLVALIYLSVKAPAVDSDPRDSPARVPVSSTR